MQYRPMTFPLVALTCVVTYILYLVTFPVQNLIANYGKIQAQMIETHDNIIKSQDEIKNAIKSCEERK